MSSLDGKVVIITGGAVYSATKFAVRAISEQARGMYQAAMPAMAIAEAIAYALTQHASVALNEIIVRPLVWLNTLPLLPRRLTSS
jgi:NADP-dependent 3-hydroxy acid dehydrogenase YdfG